MTSSGTIPHSVRPATPADHEDVLRLLRGADLPVDGVPETLADFYVAECDGRVIGAVGLESHGSEALLRSAVVDPQVQGGGLGAALVMRILQHASEGGATTIYLLTTTAEPYFHRFGFTRIAREEVAESIRASIEFTVACPASAVVMRKHLATAPRVLFLCTGNSARSQIAEAVLNRKGRGRIVAESAGSRPATVVNPLAIEALRESGITWEGHAPRGLDGLEGQHWDIVITVCDNAREACPVFPGQPVLAHWGMPDPALVEGDEAARRAAFADTVTVINRHIDKLLSTYPATA